MFFSCDCDGDEVFRVDPGTLTNEMETLLERDETEAFAPERSTQEKWGELLAVVRRAEVLRTYVYGLYGTSGGLTSFFKSMIWDLRKLVWTVLREEVRREQQTTTMMQEGLDVVDSGYNTYTPCHQATEADSVVMF